MNEINEARGFADTFGTRAARAAAAAVHVDYEVLEPVTDMFAALEPGAPEIHAGGNLLSRSVTSRGDVDSARRASAYISSGRYRTQWIEHGFMEPEASVSAIVFHHPEAVYFSVE